MPAQHEEPDRRSWWQRTCRTEHSQVPRRSVRAHLAQELGIREHDPEKSWRKAIEDRAAT